MARKTGVRLWAVAVWLLVWQGASMALGQALLLPSPLSALRRLCELALTAPFWQAVGWSGARIIGGFLLACAAGTLLAAPAAMTTQPSLIPLLLLLIY